MVLAEYCPYPTTSGCTRGEPAALKHVYIHLGGIGLATGLAEDRVLAGHLLLHLLLHLQLQLQLSRHIVTVRCHGPTTSR